MELLRALPAESKTDPDTQLLIAVLLTNGGDLPEAVKVCQQVLNLDELNAGARYLMALCREHAGDQASASSTTRRPPTWTRGSLCHLFTWDWSPSVRRKWRRRDANLDKHWRFSVAKMRRESFSLEADSHARRSWSFAVRNLALVRAFPKNLIKVATS
jgi:hypothetical protein